MTLSLSNRPFFFLLSWSIFILLQPNAVDKANVLKIKNIILCLGHNLQPGIAVKRLVFWSHAAYADIKSSQ